MDKKLLTTVSRDLLNYVSERYGGVKNYIVSLITIRFFLLMLSKTILYLSENLENKDLADNGNTIEKTPPPKKLPRGERIKKVLRKIRGGDGVTLLVQVGTFLNEHNWILTWVIQLIRKVQLRDISTSVYDFYHRLHVMKTTPELVCIQQIQKRLFL